MGIQVQEDLDEAAPSPPDSGFLASRSRVVVVSAVAGLVIVLGVVFAVRLFGGSQGPGEFIGTLKPGTSATEALTFLASSVHGRSGVASVELNTNERRLIVRFNDVGPNSAACALMRDSFHRRDILSESEVTFDSGSCNR
jgi:hypothetical protein